jgi:hypothetical protein
MSTLTCLVFGPVIIEDFQCIIKPVLSYICDCCVRSSVSISGRTIKFANSPPCTCDGSTGQKL